MSKNIKSTLQSIKTMEDEIYTVSADKEKKFGYFYINV